MFRPLILALPVLAASQPAALTPEELWSDWREQAAGFGVTLEAESVPGPDGSLTLRDWARALEGGPLEPMPSDSPVREVTLRPADGGAVAIELGLPASGVLPGAGPSGGDLRVQQEGLEIIARDGAAGIDYEIAAKALRVVSLVAPDSVATDDIAFEISGLALRFPDRLDADRSAAIGLSLDGWAYVLNLGDSASGFGSSQADRTEGRMEMTATVTMPEGMTLEEMGTETGVLLALERGFAARVEFSNEALTQAGRFEGFPFSYDYQSAAGPGWMSLSLDGSELAALGEYGSGSASGSSPLLPFPRLELAYGPMSFELRLPLGREVGEFHYLVALEGLTVNEEAWAALDPQGLLPRDAARLVLDLGGRMALDLPGMLAAEAAGAVPPVPTIESFEIRAFDLAAAGLRAEGTGSFAFGTKAGALVPAGTGSLRVEGIDRLLDALVAMGALSPQEAQEARLGLAAVFRSGGAPDTRETTIEAREDGSVFVNGQRMQ